MDSTTLASIHWHDERFNYDCQARNQQVEQACFHYFFGKKSMTIIDLGSGTGSNCLYFFEKFPSQQKWIFIEKEEIISEYALARLSKEAANKNYTATRNGASLILSKDERTIDIEYRTGSFLDLAEIVDLDKVDLVMASAVFDLIAFPQFLDIASVLLEKKLPLLTTLNYAEMNFSSEEPLDIFFIEKYESFMTRPRSFGKAMGKKCPRVLVDFFQKQKAEVIFGSSIWKLEGTPAKAMNLHVLNFMEKASSQMIENDEEKILFEKWINNKKEMIEQGTLNTYIQYYDLFVSNQNNGTMSN